MDYFEYPEASVDDWAREFDIEEVLERSHEHQKHRIEQELEQLEEQVVERDALHHEIHEELESKLDWYLDRLDTLYTRGIGHREDRDQLKAKIEEFYQLLRTEKRAHWRDTQDLKQERRSLVRELAELQDSAESVRELL